MPRRSALLWALFSALCLFLCGCTRTEASVSQIVVFVCLVVSVILLAMHIHALTVKQKRLRESNRHLSETVNMLMALETLYFSFFVVDIAQDRYRTVYIAPRLKGAVPAEGTFTELKHIFMGGMVADDFKEELLRHMDYDFIREALHREDPAADRKSFYCDYQALRGGKAVWCRVTVTAVDLDAQGYPVRVLALLQDVNTEKTKEAAYQAKILEEARAAKVANNAKDEFLRRISHDIRTPINGIQGYINMSADHPEDLALQAHCRESAASALHILLELVNNVLDMSRLESDEIRPEQKPFSLMTLLGEVDTLLRPQALSRGIRYELPCEDPVPYDRLIGSPRYLRQIFMNLAGNAIKYGHQGGYVRLSAIPVTSSDTEVTYDFIIADDGLGMSEEFQQRMFEPFAQESEDARTAYEGSGLGLSIVKKLTDALGGTITCRSEKGKGTTFCVRLTFAIDRGEIPAAVPTPDAEQMLRGRHILLAEDNALNMDIAAYLLTEKGAVVTKAWNGREAIDAFAASEEGYFDLLFLDIMMPVCDGLEAARAIRALDRPDAASVPICAMSANAFPDDIRRSLDAGINAHLAKPMDAQKLYAVVCRLLAGTTDRT